MAATGTVDRLADDQLASMADCSRSRERRNVSVRDAGGVGERIGKSAKPGAQHQSDARPQRSLL